MTRQVIQFTDLMSSKTIDSILTEIQVRFAQVSKILDGHSSPRMYGPSSQLELNYETGESRIKDSSYVVVEEGEVAPNYLTWDGKIENSLSEIELLFNQLYIISEISPSLLGEAKTTGQASSGTALRLKMISTILKLQRYSNILDKKAKKAIKLMLELQTNKEVQKKDISITWKDNIPKDPKEEAEIADIRTGGKPTQSQFKSYTRIRR